MIEQEQVLEKKSNESLPELKFYPGLDVYTKFGDLDSRILYVRYFSKLPNVIEVVDIDKDAFRYFFQKEYKPHILKEYYTKAVKKKNKEFYFDHIFLLSGEIIVNIEDNNVFILSENTETEHVKEIVFHIKKFRNKKKKKSEMCLIISSNSGLDTRKIKFKKPKISLEENYNDGFAELHSKFVEQLKKKNESGLFLFHGKPGTGKSTYIRYLIKKLNKKAIFMSPKMAGSLDQVAMTKLLLDNRNCILVVEDAEELVVSRHSGRNSNLSMILNLTDGILGESLGIQIIATFNTDLKNIDSALMRKGRLKAAYEFTELSVEKTNALLKNQNIDIVVNKPLTLAEIFNFYEENNHFKLQKAVGFKN